MFEYIKELRVFRELGSSSKINFKERKEIFWGIRRGFVTTVREHGSIDPNTPHPQLLGGPQVFRVQLLSQFSIGYFQIGTHVVWKNYRLLGQCWPTFFTTHLNSFILYCAFISDIMKNGCSFIGFSAPKSLFMLMCSKAHITHSSNPFTDFNILFLAAA